jgi:hypothetical protein
MPIRTRGKYANKHGYNPKLRQACEYSQAFTINSSYVPAEEGQGLALAPEIAATFAAVPAVNDAEVEEAPSPRKRSRRYSTRQTFQGHTSPFDFCPWTNIPEDVLRTV